MNDACVLVSVVVPCRNEAEHIKGFLENVLAQEPPSGGFEVIIADGLSTDGTRQIIEEFCRKDARLRLIDNPDLHVSSALNRAVKIANGTIIVRMDVHTLYASDYIRQCVSVLEETGAQNVGGPARTLAEGYVQKANALAYHSPFSVGGARFHNVDYEGPVDTVTYGCWWREYLIEVGLFDENLIRNQDDELNLRIIRKGGVVWQSPKIRSWYYPRSTIRGIFRQYYQYGFWKVFVIRKHRLPASFRHIVPSAFVLWLLSSGVCGGFYYPLRVAFIATVVAYGFASIIASIEACKKSRTWTCLPVLPVVFAAYHFGYGFGFTRGLLSVLTGEGKIPSSAIDLTRGSKESFRI